MAAQVIPVGDADPDQVDRLGGKGAGLAAMTRDGLPVPPGFIITTDACRAYLEHGRVPESLFDQVHAQLRALEQTTGKSFGAGPRPLLVSVRSGAPISMPGMMDTILNLGLNRESAIAIGELTRDSRFVADLVRRFHGMYAETVLNAMEEPDGILDLVAATPRDADPAEVYERIWAHCAEALEEELGEQVPRDPQAQLEGAIEAVLSSWNTRRARTYREFHGIPHTLGTAVVVQTMVFGNMDDRSGSGVVFTRNPMDGTPTLYGEFLIAGQGEDVVSGVATPDPIQVAEVALPEVFSELRRLCAELERSRGDVLDIEFTIEHEKLYFLQVRSAKRTAEAAVRIAADLMSEGVHPRAALAGLSIEHVRQIQRPAFDEQAAARAREDGSLLTTGTGACPGQVSGRLCFDSDQATKLAEDGTDVILARQITSPADLHGMIAARGIVTATGGSTSHAAVVARALGTACVVGCGDLAMDETAGTLTLGDLVLHAGEEVSLDGGSGEVFRGLIPVKPAADRTPALAEVTGWCAERSGAELYARITLPGQASEAAAVGARGVVAGLDDVLAASGHLDELLATLLSGSEQVDVGLLEAVVERELTGLLAACDGLDVSLRGIDFLSDDSREYVQQTPLLTRYPQLSLPLGMTSLVRAQLAGLARAMTACGRRNAVSFAVRHISDPREAALLADLGRSVAQDYPQATITVSSYATSARTLARADLLAEAPVSWLELRTIQAAHRGLPPRLLLTKQPLDDYLRAGLLELDPRTQLDPEVADRIAAVAGIGAGARLSLPVTEGLVADLFSRGVRRFAVELTEVRPLLVALGKAVAAA